MVLDRDTIELILLKVAGVFALLMIAEMSTWPAHGAEKDSGTKNLAESREDTRATEREKGDENPSWVVPGTPGEPAMRIGQRKLRPLL